MEQDAGKAAGPFCGTGAQGCHWRGMPYEAAAREAHRSARTRWCVLPDDRVGTGKPTARQTARRLAEPERD